jgi:hypothetical protein
MTKFGSGSKYWLKTKIFWGALDFGEMGKDIKLQTNPEQIRSKGRFRLGSLSSSAGEFFIFLIPSRGKSMGKKIHDSGGSFKEAPIYEGGAKSLG